METRRGRECQQSHDTQPSGEPNQAGLHFLKSVTFLHFLEPKCDLHTCAEIAVGASDRTELETRQ
jgi:hypothetical protein